MQTVQTQVVTLSIQVSGGEIAIKVKNGKRSFYWNAHPLTEMEFRKLWALKRPNI